MKINNLFYLKALLIYLIMCSSFSTLYSQKKLSYPIDKNEKWYGAAVNEGHKAPFIEGYQADLNNNVYGNQASPLLLSNKGRYIWSDQPFAFKLENNEIIIFKNNAEIIMDKSGTSLKDAYNAASKIFFPPKGVMPDELLFSSPQYNTWIELIYNQNQDDILKYAHNIIDNGFPPGVLMIDDNWAPYYGRFEFRKDRFNDPKAMINELHELGFKVMMWVSPFIRPDSEEARFLMKKKWVLMDNEGIEEMKWAEATKPSIQEWWNGFSMVMDFTNPEAVDWFQEQLDKVANEYGVDGFKLDGGDPEFYAENVVTFKDATPNDHTRLWGLFGLKYPLNEYRAMWKMGGEPLVERLRDKFHTWTDLNKLIPHITTSSLLGYPFACPDMIGGGDYSSFIDVDSKKLDQELIVRSTQVHSLMPMMQFSVAPWRILDKKHFDAVKKAVDIRQQFVPLIIELAEKAALTGEPIISNMEYVFPGEGFESCNDQFMLGEKILVAPMTKKGNKRDVKLPKGKWIDSKGVEVKGGITFNYVVELDELLWFKKKV